MKAIFVTATNTDIGKTYATLKLIEAFSKKGFKVGVFKPIETGVEGIAHDGKLLLEKCRKHNPLFNDIEIEDIVPIQFSLPAAPFAAKGKNKIDFEKIKTSYKKIQNLCDIALIEGAGGLMVPVEDDFFMVDFIKMFDASALLVTHDKLGCINDTLLSLNLLVSKNIKHKWCINIKDNEEDFKKTTLSYYQKKFGNILFLDRDLEKICEKLLSNG